MPPRLRWSPRTDVRTTAAADAPPRHEWGGASASAICVCTARVGTVKRSGLLHADLAGHLARLGHTDQLVVADRGLPLPPGVPVVDLALVPGVVDLRTVLDALLAEVVVQAHTIALEAAAGPFPQWLDARAHDLGERHVTGHDELKAMLPGVRLAVRTGEETPYANVILECGVPFG